MRNQSTFYQICVGTHIDAHIQIQEENRLCEPCIYIPALIMASVHSSCSLSNFILNV